MTFQRAWHKHYPAGIPPELDFAQLTMPEFLTRSANRFPGKAALDYLGRKITYPQLDALVNQFARALIDLGVEKGDTVAMLLPNIPQLVIANYATWRIGAITAMNNPLYTERELTHQLNLSDAKLLVTLDLLHPRALNLMKTTPVEKVIVCHINDYLAFPKKQLFPCSKSRCTAGSIRGRTHLNSRPLWPNRAVMLLKTGRTWTRWALICIPAAPPASARVL